MICDWFSIFHYLILCDVLCDALIFLLERNTLGMIETLKKFNVGASIFRINLFTKMKSGSQDDNRVSLCCCLIFWGSRTHICIPESIHCYCLNGTVFLLLKL